MEGSQGLLAWPRWLGAIRFCAAIMMSSVRKCAIKMRFWAFSTVAAARYSPPEV